MDNNNLNKEINESAPGRSFLLALSLISFTVLAFQLGLVRLFSVMVWYHFTFMIISLALLGYGAAGSFLSIFKDKISKTNPAAFFVNTSLLAGASLIFTYVFICYYPPDPFNLLTNNEVNSSTAILIKWLIFLAGYVMLLLPFFLAGLVMSAAISLYPSSVNRIYFFDLAGAGIGCLGMLFFLSWFGGERSALLCGVLFFASALLFAFSFKSQKGGKKRIFQKAAPITGMIFAAAAMILIPLFVKIPIAPGKALNSVVASQYQKILFTRWNAISRIDVISTLDQLLLWKVSKTYDGPMLPGKGLMIDADAFTPIVGDNGDEEAKKILNYTITSIAYQFGKRESALIIGPGGGVDVLTADYNKIKDITGVELNPLIVKIVGDEFSDFNKGLYHKDNIKIFSDEGRSFVNRSSRKYDLIQIPLVDTWAALTSGAYSLSENYLYTSDAIIDYWNHLSEDGALSIIRWNSMPSTGLLRLCANVDLAFRTMGINNPEQHIFISTDGNLTNFILSKKPFTNNDTPELINLMKKYDYDVLYLPNFKSVTWPFVYGIGYDKEKILSKSGETSDSKVIFRDIKPGEYKTGYINPEYAADSSYYDEKVMSIFKNSMDSGVLPVYYSGIDGYNDFEKFFAAVDKKEFFKQYPLKITPTTDESPFFFQHFKFLRGIESFGIMKQLSLLGFSSLISQAGIVAVLSLFFIAAAFSLVLIVFPLFISKRDVLNQKGKLVLFIYFACLGFAYIFIEISQIQRFILFLGQPVYSISIALFTFLTSSGIGSWVTGGKKTSIKNTVTWSVLGIFIISCFYFFVQKEIFGLFLSGKFITRIMISVIMLFPLGFLMGSLFPAGVRLAKRVGKESLLPWLWAVNGLCSVLGSILASFLAMQMGFSNLLLLASAIYLTAVLCLKRIIQIND